MPYEYIESPEVKRWVMDGEQRLEAERELSTSIGTALANELSVEAPLSVLLRGVGLRSPLFAAARAGVAQIHGAWVLEDYPAGLPPASYWADRALTRWVFEALGHAFGGDHPAPWEVASGGVVLGRGFEVRDLEKGASISAEERASPVAWKWGRDERLVFMAVECATFSPISLLELAVGSSAEAAARCGAAYVHYLMEQAAFGIHKKAARDLLPSYVCREQLRISPG